MYVNPGSVLAISILLPVLGSAAVAARFATRIRQKQRLGPDDWLCVPALAFLITTGALIIYGVAGKTFGYHTPSSKDLNATLSSIAPQLLLLTKLEWVINLLNPVGTGFIRLSFMFFYRRLFRGRAFNVASWILIGILITWMCVAVIAYLTVCHPISAAWGSVADIDAHCKSPRWLLGAFGIIGLVIDISILVFPFFWIWRLQMDRSKKLAVSSVFLCGLFIVSASALRAAAGLKSATVKYGVEQNYLGLKSTSDVIGRVSILIFWQYIENGTGLVVCCLPSLKPILNSEYLKSVQTSLNSLFSSLKSAHSSKYSESTNSEDTKDPTRKSSSITVTRSFDLSSMPMDKETV